jgi:hypothetical protein
MSVMAILLLDRIKKGVEFAPRAAHFINENPAQKFGGGASPPEKG